MREIDVDSADDNYIAFVCVSLFLNSRKIHSRLLQKLKASRCFHARVSVPDTICRDRVQKLSRRTASPFRSCYFNSSRQKLPGETELQRLEVRAAVSTRRPRLPGRKYRKTGVQRNKKRAAVSTRGLASSRQNLPRKTGVQCLDRRAAVPRRGLDSRRNVPGPSTKALATSEPESKLLSP